jgi:hypothetical protein
MYLGVFEEVVNILYTQYSNVVKNRRMYRLLGEASLPWFTAFSKVIDSCIEDPADRADAKLINVVCPKTLEHLLNKHKNFSDKAIDTLCNFLATLKKFLDTREKMYLIMSVRYPENAKKFVNVSSKIPGNLPLVKSMIELKYDINDEIYNLTDRLVHSFEANSHIYYTESFAALIKAGFREELVVRSRIWDNLDVTEKSLYYLKLLADAYPQFKLLLDKIMKKDSK